jgi:Ni/Fe-hydrogenase subunit HybB-like protein
VVAGSRARRSLGPFSITATSSGVYLEKGIGLIVPGFVPSTLHEMVEYLPTLVEWKVTAGIWALGLIVLTVTLKIGLAVWSGRLSAARADAAS